MVRHVNHTTGALPYPGLVARAGAALPAAAPCVEHATVIRPALCLKRGIKTFSLLPRPVGLV